MADVEWCCGCGRQLETPAAMMAVLRDPIGDGWILQPVCTPCFIDPTHRSVTLKAHFFPRQRAESARRQAGASTITP